MHIFFILGADRVGKSTYVDNLISCLIDQDKSFRKYHFSGPQPNHNTPIDQYTLPLQEGIDSGAEFHICDRGGSEVCFYEKYRRGIDIDVSWAQCFESWCLSKFDKVNVVLLNKNWGNVLEFRHLQEIDQLYPNSTEWFRRQQLLSRKAEHLAYYDYMHKYFSLIEGHTLFDQNIISMQSNNLKFDVSFYLEKLGVISPDV